MTKRWRRARSTPCSILALVRSFIRPSLSREAFAMQCSRSFDSGREPTKGREEAVSTLVHRDGAHQITVHDTVGREAVLITEGHTLHITTSGEGPYLTPQMAQELADQLHQWAVCQQTVRSHVPKRVLSAA